MTNRCIGDGIDSFKTSQRLPKHEVPLRSASTSGGPTHKVSPPYRGIHAPPSAKLPCAIHSAAGSPCINERPPVWPELLAGGPEARNNCFRKYALHRAHVPRKKSLRIPDSEELQYYLVWRVRGRRQGVPPHIAIAIRKLPLQSKHRKWGSQLPPTGVIHRALS